MCDGNDGGDVDCDDKVDKGERRAELDNEDASDLHPSVDTDEDEIELRRRGIEESIISSANGLVQKFESIIGLRARRQKSR